MSAPSENLRLFQYYNGYRIFIFGLLFVSALMTPHFGANVRFPQWYVLVTFSYSLACVGVAVRLRSRDIFTHREILINGLLDMLVIHALLFFSGGISGGLINLQFVAIAAANIIVRGRIGYFLAAVASLLTLAVSLESLTLQGTMKSVGDAGLVGGVYFAIALLVQNISERISKSEALAKRQQQDIVELEKLNDIIIQNMRTGIIVANASGVVLHCNRASLDLLGVDLLPRLYGQLNQDLSTWLLDERYRAPSFKPGPDMATIQANFMRLNMSDQDQAVIFLEDTRRVAQQVQQMKLASLGRLTASIAHEIRNPLAAISTANQLMLESENADDESLKFNHIIQRHAERMNNIIENVLSMSRRNDPDIKLININEWLERLTQDYVTMSENGHIVTLKLPQQILEAQCDALQVEQVLTNLLDNAVRHACEGEADAQVTISASVTSQGQSYIDITDSGPGVPSENIEMLFEPFFTTASKGTGLGLYLSRELCEANQASLDYVESESSQGACFRILFSHVKKEIQLSKSADEEPYEKRA